MALIWKLLTLIAVLLLPFGMAPAVGAPPQHHPASMAMQHCPDQGAKHDKGAFAECTMACSAALPAVIATAHEPAPVTHQITQPATQLSLHGLHPETATPPPKTS